jgi:hypothetical protein
MPKGLQRTVASPRKFDNAKAALEPQNGFIFMMAGMLAVAPE